MRIKNVISCLKYYKKGKFNHIKAFLRYVLKEQNVNRDDHAIT